jgi:glutamate/tyrosine decarboxylase-like PLP-dependent enzyme
MRGVSNSPASAPTTPAPIRALPEHGRAHADLLDALRALHGADVDWKGGRVFSLVYHAGDAHSAFLKEAHSQFFSENGLNPLAFQSLKRMEKEVVRMTATMLHGDANAVGTMTSGGTESLLLAVKTYRDLARKKRPWIRRPNVVLPVSAHPAFDKAAHYFGVRLKKAPLGADLRVDVKKLARLVDRNTVMIAASAPQYPHGVIDPIGPLGELAREKGLPFHVDACVGGFLLPFLEKLGLPVPPWDFRVPGVTSISADIHKYGYAAKGASTITYRSIDLLKHQFFVATDFPGGIYVSPSMPGTRPGGPIAAAWAGLQALGEDGLTELARRAWEATRKLRDGIASIEGLRLVTDDPTTIVCWASADAAIDTFAVADQMEDRGWLVDRQHRPTTVHLTVTANHLAIADEYVADLRASVAHVRAHPELRSRGNAAMYGLVARLPARGAVRVAVERMVEQMYGPDDAQTEPGKDGAVAKLLEKYGERALSALDRFDSIKSRVLRR